MIVQDFNVVVDTGGDWAPVSVCIPLFNYQNYIVETLNSILSQSEPSISLVVVDDGSRDESVAVVERWLAQFSSRFSRAVLAANVENAGLAVTRNTSASIAGSKFLFFLDADNIVYPSCLKRHREVLEQSPGAQGAYSLIEVFDAQTGVMGGEAFHAGRFQYGNHIDAMAMLRREFLLSIGGYLHIQYGWEDYDLWLRMCESGEYIIQIPEILSRYRVHKQSMLRSLTNVNDNHVKLRRDMINRHPWLTLD
ncbi:glycosyltransferase family 2 protein [Novosphingobium umbonatum]|uniref:Glycosyltransferase family 2 protein n=1 Tax=Novosphingobium umbonatum TaxID=1908524 RepID=A0A3S2UQ43_9SPHN|nr:glycosyltransferase family A protein [Novosphingobium umbonatum]RVU03272.1 glycosyltransferase family 2 protein [Novosphingobium umbonatum]